MLPRTPAALPSGRRTGLLANRTQRTSPSRRRIRNSRGAADFDADADSSVVRHVGEIVRVDEAVQERRVLEELPGHVPADLLACWRHVLERSVRSPPELPVVGEVGNRAVARLSLGHGALHAASPAELEDEPGDQHALQDDDDQPEDDRLAVLLEQPRVRWSTMLAGGSIRSGSPQRSSSRASNIGARPTSVSGMAEGRSPPRTRSARSAATFPTRSMLTSSPPRMPAPRSS
jgi:hypothetical protein